MGDTTADKSDFPKQRALCDSLEEYTVVFVFVFQDEKKSVKKKRKRKKSSARRAPDSSGEESDAESKVFWYIESG